MIVTQSDYLQWQQMYGHKNGNATGAIGNGADEKGDGEGQKFAMSGFDQGNKSAVQPETTESKEAEPSFIETAFEKLLANKLGIDQEKFDELKQEIKETEDAIEVLDKQKPLNEQQKQQMSLLEERLEMLKKALEELVKQGSERANEQEASGQNDSEQKTMHQASQYSSVASLL